MKFFNAKELEYMYETMPNNCIWAEYLADYLNNRLNLEGRIVIGSPLSNWNECGNRIETHKALLINIEPIENCKHESHKVSIEYSKLNKISYYLCGECGVEVIPNSFEEKK